MNVSFPESLKDQTQVSEGEGGKVLKVLGSLFKVFGRFDLRHFSKDIRRTFFFLNFYMDFKLCEIEYFSEMRSFGNSKKYFFFKGKSL